MDIITKDDLAASILRRFFAFFFDWVIVNILCFMMILAGIAALSLKADGNTMFVYGGSIPSAIPSLWLFLFTAYHTFFVYNGGQTPAKMLFKIKVVNIDHDDISLTRAGLRAFGYSLSLFMLIGFLMAIVTKNHRALHDFIGHTKVIETGPAGLALKKQKDSPGNKVAAHHEIRDFL